MSVLTPYLADCSFVHMAQGFLERRFLLTLFPLPVGTGGGKGKIKLVYKSVEGKVIVVVSIVCDPPLLAVCGIGHGGMCHRHTDNRTLAKLFAGVSFSLDPFFGMIQPNVILLSIRFTPA